MPATQDTKDAGIHADLGVGPPTARAWLAIGGLAAALGASSCCVVPFALFTLGVSGAWIGNLTALAPYQPAFVVAALAFMGAGFVRVRRRNREKCADGDVCARSVSDRAVKATLWTAAALVTIAIAFPYAAPLFIGA